MCKLPVARLGESICYIELSPCSIRKGKFDNAWREGTWLGHTRASNAHAIGIVDGVVRAYAMKRQTPAWDGVLVNNMRGTPFQPHPLRSGLAIPISVSFSAGAEVRGPSV